MNPSQNCDQSSSKRVLEASDLQHVTTTNLRSKHLSKSASELSCITHNDEMTDVRPQSAAGPSSSHTSVYHKAHSFFAQLKNRWGHGKHKDRRHKSPGRQDSMTDYAADVSSDHSTPSTQSPRHRHLAYTDSPLNRACLVGASDTPHSSPGGSPRPRAPTLSAVAGLDLIPVTSTDEISRRRETALRQHSFFQLRIHLRRGHGLVAMDKNGTSDPYVKFKAGGRLVYKSRTVYRDLNPVWDESFTVPIEDPFMPIHIKVFDYDWGLQDDFMGSSFLDLTSLELGRPCDIILVLQDSDRPGAALGDISLTATLFPRSQEDKEQFAMWNYTATSKIRRRLKSKVTKLGDKIHSEFFGSLEDLSTPDCLNFAKKKLRQAESDVEDYVVEETERGLRRYDSTPIPQIDVNSSVHDQRGMVEKETAPSQFIEKERKLFDKLEHKFNIKAKTEIIQRLLIEISPHYNMRKLRLCQAVLRYQQTFPESGRLTTTVQSTTTCLINLSRTCLSRISRSSCMEMRQYFQKNSKVADVNKRLKSQIWSSVVTIVLIEGKNLLACDPETGTSDPYVKFRLGNEKYKSRIIWRSLNPRWLEQFDLHLYDDGDQQLEISVWDKDRSRDDFIGRVVIDLMQLGREKTHSIWTKLDDGAGSLHILLTISGTTASETISDLTSYEENPKGKEVILNRYAWHKTFHNIKDVGHLTVKVFRATGLAAADLGGKSDPFCVLELGNARLQTQTEYKTLTPSWQKIFTFNVKDINNCLEVTVYDEDRDHKVEFLGKVAIPLLRIKNGEKRWYALKDKKLRSRAKGQSPQILLEMTVSWNPIRAFIRTLNPREEKYMQTELKFKRQVFVKNVLRLKVIVLHFYELGKVLQNCFEWESTTYSFIALVFFLILCYYFEPWMVPVGGLLVFLKQYLVKKITGPQAMPWDEVADSDLDDDEDDDKEKEEKKSLKERLQTIQEVTQGVQNVIGKLATFGESVKNTFNFTVPYLSWIAVILLVGAVIVLYIMPIRYLLMIWGANKFFRRLLRPHSVPNNELLDLISRVPDDEMLLDYRDLKILMSTTDQEAKRREPRKKNKVS